MDENTGSVSAAKRKIRPWLAGLLTILGWGVGLYYARQTRAAIYLVIGQLVAITVIAGMLLTILAFLGPLQFPLANPNGFSATDIALWTLTIIVAIWVWRFVAKRETLVERGGTQRLLGYLGIWLLPIIGAVLIALLIRMFLLQPFNTPAGSMRPSLQVGDFFVVSKLTYAPVSGDIVVFKNEKDGNRSYVKRLIGMPGDTVQMLGGRLHINGKPVQKDILDAAAPDACGAGFAGPVYRETLENGVSYIVQECAGDDGHLDNTSVYQVPAGHYFMMGDNRDQSQDSRMIAQVGYVADHSLIGKALINNGKAH